MCIRDSYYAVKTIPAKNSEHAENVDVAVIDERFTIVRDFAGNIATMNISELSLATVGLHCLVEVALCHFRERSQAELQRIAGAGAKIEHALIEVRLINEPGLAAHGLSL